MHLKLLIRFILLATGFALTTYGVLGWHHLGFDMAITLAVPEAHNIHPVYLLILGLALIPPSLWEIFLFQARIEDDTTIDQERD